jgi:hypothetical protein
MYSIIILKMESEKVAEGQFYKRIVEIVAESSYVGVQQPSSAHFFSLKNGSA